MNKLEKLTEATILALQGKLVEKENMENSAINAKIRNAGKYVDDLAQAGLLVGVSSNYDNYSKLEDEISGISYLGNDYDGFIYTPTQELYNKVIAKMSDADTLVMKKDTTSDSETYAYNPFYDVNSKELVSFEDYYDGGLEREKINKDTDIFNFLDVKASRLYGDIEHAYNEPGDLGFTNYNKNYRDNAKYSDDTLKNSPELRDMVKNDLDYYNKDKDRRNNLMKDRDELNKNNFDFSKDDEIISTSAEIDDLNASINKRSKADGTFDVRKSRDDANTIVPTVNLDKDDNNE